MRSAFCSAAAAAIAVGALAAPASALSITETNDSGALASTLFLNTDLSIMNDSLSGEFGQAGLYTNLAGTYGLPNSGIVLSTGYVSNYETGPNTSGSTSGSFGNFEEGDGDGGDGAFFIAESSGGSGPIEIDESGFFGSATPEQHDLLFPITGQNEHFDVVQLDIDFFAQTPAETVTFFATFGSEEFPVFVDSGFNDGFGLYVNGVNYAGTLQTGGQPGDPLLPININHPDFAEIPGTELNGVLAPNGSPVLRFDVPINPSAANTFTIILADSLDDGYDSTVYLSSLFSDPTAGGVGASEFNPILPSNPPNPETGAFEIEIPDGLAAGETAWIDPPIAVGYEYEINGGEFATVTAPSLATVADVDGYIITVGAESALIAAGQTLNFFDEFGLNPTFFTLTGIDEALALDPLNQLAFPTGVSFVGQTFQTVVNMTPIVMDDNVGAVPLPASMLLYLGGLAGFGFVARRRRAVRAA